MSDQHTQPKPRKPNRTAIALATAAIIAAGGAWSLQSFAGSKAIQHMKVHTQGNAGWFNGLRHNAGWRRERHADFFEMSDAEIDAKLTRVVKHVAIEIDATVEQQAKIIALVTATAKELKPLRGTMRDTGKRVHELLLADAIDRDALETLRAERLADSDRISKTLVNTVADIAEVLSPKQRKLLEEMRSKHKRWHRG